MPERTAKVGSPVGLHARPAAIVAKIAAKHDSPVHIGRTDGEPADARSVLALMGLGIKSGETVTVRAEGDGADVLLEQLVAAIEAHEPSAADVA